MAKIDTFLNNLNTPRLILIITELYWIDYEGKVERGIVTEIGKECRKLLGKSTIRIGS